MKFTAPLFKVSKNKHTVHTHHTFTMMSVFDQILCTDWNLHSRQVAEEIIKFVEESMFYRIDRLARLTDLARFGGIGACAP